MQRSKAYIPFWRDERFLRISAQVIFLLILAGLLATLLNNMLQALRQQGLVLGFSFLQLTSGFDIGETLIPYDRSATYGRAFLVGLLNTAYVSLLGIVFATLIGLVIGVARLSRNFLIQLLARIYIEALRNIPLLVLLIFIYSGVFLKFPQIRQPLYLGPIMFTNRGVFAPWPVPTETFPIFRLFIFAGLVAAILTWIGLWRYGQKTGRAPLTWFWSALIWLSFVLLGWLVLASRPPLALEFPRLEGLRMLGGRRLTPEFMSLWSGLVIYTSAFIADVVRAGIQAVPKGQVEAARALGLSGFQSLRLIVLPQALRVIVPPLTSHYLNLTKNSSLAVAVGYPDLFSVSGTILNQSGRAVEVIALAMSIYLSLSLLTSLFMNWYNRRIRFVER
uniref:L-amino acid transport system permease protein n=1 Tax=uncultured Chloroflexota bacterium TaxID=166587 RepID=H5SK77_9CHLR|nr:polar amino acid ABC transporter inner membrane subunit [uncultured bacterium]BAL56563.1 L-amino acid transport system permease protein [uncultured Chloroflexota bacterium]